MRTLVTIGVYGWTLETFLDALRGQIGFLQQGATDDRVLDAWYTTMHHPVTEVPGLSPRLETIENSRRVTGV